MEQTNVPPWLPDVSAMLGAMSAALARADFKKDDFVDGRGVCLKTWRRSGRLCTFPSLHLLAQARTGSFPEAHRLNEQIGANRDVLQEFYENFGGNVFLCHQAIDKLREQFRMGQERLFDPFDVRGNAGLGDLVGDSRTREHMENLAEKGWSPDVRGNAGLGDLVGDSRTREHMENLAEKGWSPIQDGSAEGETESQEGARIIAKNNFGAIIDRQSTTFLDQALKEEMFGDPNVDAQEEGGWWMRGKCTQRMVETMKSSALDVFNANSEAF
eukprot:s6634_g6.t3